ncbi:nitroreductase family protein [Thiobacillus sedimenti]|uniref:Molybdopterin biosynthesis protein MoeY n=1 Tax=Thiobacillus sedimenti TaxID=3110231 RepID=A0ABZ1CJT2_9PROT|nr:molybdopterin biosynthesis protein MoeY [Thiobacillus sp. SCUT-2]WRS39501.1 molybdopterin biosynthesis protein MoeY [Thiobacillus sp. SCUT-2]
MSIPSPVREVIELARWAPSGDNTQPWRFEIVDAHHFIVHAFDTREHCVYDLDGHPSQIAVGAMLETLAIAASAHGLRAVVGRRPGSPDTHPDYSVELVPDAAIAPDRLLDAVKRRTVQRRPLRTDRLSAADKLALEEAVGDGFSVCWFEGAGLRWRLARLMFANARLRLTMPEAYLVHRDIIEWQAQYSEDKVPDRALGLDAGTLRLMRWVMGSWQRVRFFNTWLAGHLTPRIEMDLLPGFLCAAHFAIRARTAPKTVDDYVAAGRAVQRFWLTATNLGLQLQPELTPLIFSRYVREGVAFSGMPGARETAERLNRRLGGILQGVPLDQVAFLGRIGRGRPATSRSLRLPVERLMRGD